MLSSKETGQEIFEHMIKTRVFNKSKIVSGQELESVCKKLSTADYGIRIEGEEELEKIIKRDPKIINLKRLYSKVKDPHKGLYLTQIFGIVAKNLPVEMEIIYQALEDSKVASLSISYAISEAYRQDPSLVDVNRIISNLKNENEQVSAITIDSISNMTTSNIESMSEHLPRVFEIIENPEYNDKDLLINMLVDTIIIQEPEIIIQNLSKLLYCGNHLIAKNVEERISEILFPIFSEEVLFGDGTSYTNLGELKDPKLFEIDWEKCSSEFFHYFLDYLDNNIDLNKTLNTEDGFGERINLTKILIKEVINGKDELSSEANYILDYLISQIILRIYDKNIKESFKEKYTTLLETILTEMIDSYGNDLPNNVCKGIGYLLSQGGLLINKQKENWSYIKRKEMTFEQVRELMTQLGKVGNKMLGLLIEKGGLTKEELIHTNKTLNLGPESGGLLPQVIICKRDYRPEHDLCPFLNEEIPISQNVLTLKQQKLRLFIYDLSQLLNPMHIQKAISDYFNVKLVDHGLEIFRNEDMIFYYPLKTLAEEFSQRNN